MMTAPVAFEGGTPPPTDVPSYLPSYLGNEQLWKRGHSFYPLESFTSLCYLLPIN